MAWILRNILSSPFAMIYIKRNILYKFSGFRDRLDICSDLSFFLAIPLYVFGPETHMTAIVAMALGIRPIPQENNVETATANFALPTGEKQPNKQKLVAQNKEAPKTSVACSRNAKVSFVQPECVWLFINLFL